VADLGVASPANYLYPSPMIALSPAIADWCGQSLAPERGIVEACHDLNLRIKSAFKYDGDATETDTAPAQAFEKRAGVCQDFAQVMIAGLRSAGVPAAYVSGYLRTLPPPGKARLIGADATHAWVLAWCGPARGWIGFDPTNGIAMNTDHIITAIGRDYADIAPIDGIFVGQAGQKIAVSVDVAPAE
jgi:transglutaminase-like putative cysteine protease